ncbi:MAG: N-acetylneuraminate synthase family protein [Candidatus Omnitrophica bacterium]|nr:N-acetylneuraminate synthase family protein [Candidatus Omnitrophota bacterium]MDD5652671.1 N-acetylneuraminate synthase family protein [Candidatus Omnitrophota bacterium]
MPVFIIAELGINHNGDINIAKKLIDGAVFSGADAVKFQKRTIDKVYSKAELDKTRESPWGNTTREQKFGLEFSEDEYDEIDQYCREKKIQWFASAWDIDSQVFLRKYNLKYNKVSSAMLTHRDLLEKVSEEKKYTFISTGMSNMEEIEKAIKIFKQNKCPFELMHCNSTYPMPDIEANLKLIPFFKEKFGCQVGYSSHDVGLITPCAAVALGATSVEKHITLDRAMYGSDQAASVEIMGFYRLVNYIRTIEKALGDGLKRVTAQEEIIKQKLRKVNTL